MEYLKNEQVYHILQNLSNLEIAYAEYSKTSPDFRKYDTYLDYFNNYVIRSHNLGRFYFPVTLTKEMKLPTYITDLPVIPESLNFPAGYDISIGKVFNSPDLIRHKSEYYTLVYLMSGNGTLLVGEQTCPMAEGDFYWVPPLVEHCIDSRPESICVCFNFRCAYMKLAHQDFFRDNTKMKAFFAGVLEKDPDMTYLAMHTRNTEEIRTLALNLIAEYINNKAYADSAMKGYLSLLTTAILREPQTVIETPVPIDKGSANFEEVLTYVKRNYQTANLGSAAEALHFSRQYLCRIVKDATGKTFQTLLTDIRLEIAKSYLKETQLPLADIAEMSGFATAAHFSRTFRDKIGCAPSQYRNTPSQ